MNYEMIIATTNEDKMREFRDFFAPYNITLYSLKDVNLDISIPETGQTFLDNAMIKARIVSKYVNKTVLADDSGLQIEALGEFPGTKSARFMAGSSYKDKMEAILRMMNNHHNRKAQFSCTLVMMNPNGEYRIFIGTASGKITEQIIGENGFGYDPIFLCDELNKSFGEASGEEKAKYSHRGKAVNKAITCLVQRSLIKKDNSK
jgi:XTP/dITP diphosphohydrolase